MQLKVSAMAGKAPKKAAVKAAPKASKAGKGWFGGEGGAKLDKWYGEWGAQSRDCAGAARPLSVSLTSGAPRGCASRRPAFRPTRRRAEGEGARLALDETPRLTPAAPPIATPLFAPRDTHTH